MFLDIMVVQILSVSSFECPGESVCSGRRPSSILVSGTLYGRSNPPIKSTTCEREEDSWTVRF